MQKISKNDLLVFKKLGIERYIDGMSIKHILPEILVAPSLSKQAQQRLKWMDHYHRCGVINPYVQCRGRLLASLK